MGKNYVGASDDELARHMGSVFDVNEQAPNTNDDFDVVSNYQNMNTTDTGNKSGQTYTSTAIAKNPTTGQQKSMATWDYTDPKTGKNYSGSTYTDPQGNAETQKNYQEGKQGGQHKEREAEYGPEYDDMVARVKKLAGLGPMKTVYDPAKRQYRNMPTAQQPKK